MTLRVIGNPNDTLGSMHVASTPPDAIDIEIYNRQERLDLAYPDHGVAVIGVGGVGSWAALLLAMSGVSPLYLFDPDHFEATNRNRVPILPADLGKQKSIVIRDMCLLQRPDSAIMAYGKADSDTLSSVEPSVILDCTDRETVQSMLYKYAQSERVAYIRAGYDGTGLTLSSVVPEWVVPDSEAQPEGYRIVPSWAVPAVMIAAMAVAKIMWYPNLQFAGDLSEVDPTKRSQVFVAHYRSTTESPLPTGEIPTLVRGVTGQAAYRTWAERLSAIDATERELEEYNNNDEDTEHDDAS
jgi:hypothetical protein